MNMSSDNESSHSRFIDKILSDDEDDTSDESRAQQFNNSDEDIFNMSTQRIEQAACTSNSIYDKETQPIAFSSPFKPPVQSALHRNIVSPTKKTDRITPVLSIFEMETQEIGADTGSYAANESALAATPPYRPDWRGERKDGWKSNTLKNNNSPIEDIHLAATQKLFPESPIIEIGGSQENESSPETQAFEFCPDMSMAPTQPLIFQKSANDFADDSEGCTPPISPRILVPQSTEGEQQAGSKYASHGKESDEETPPSSPVIDLNFSSSLILNSTHRSDDLSVFNQTEDQQCIPETQAEADEPRQKLYPMLNFPSSQSSTSSNKSAREVQDRSDEALEEPRLSSSPILDCFVTPVKSTARGTRSTQLDSSPQLFDLQGSPVPNVEPETSALAGDSCDPFAPTQALNLDSDVPATKERPQSVFIDQFAPTQRLDIVEEPEDESILSPVLCCAIDEDAEDADAFAATQKLVIRTASEDEQDFPRPSSPKKSSQPKVIIRKSEISSTVTDAEAIRPTLAFQNPSDEQQQQQQPEADAETDTDFEMTFSGSQASVAGSPEPFRGFSRREMQESGRHVQQLHRIIDDSEAEETNEDDSSQASYPARFLDFGTDYVEPEPLAPARRKKKDIVFEVTPVAQPKMGPTLECKPQAKTEPESGLELERKSEPEPEPESELRPVSDPVPVPQSAPAVEPEPEPVRRSVRKRLPNSRLTEGEIYQLDSTTSRRSTRSTASSGASRSKKSRNSTITLVTSTPSSSSSTSGRGRKRASPNAEPPAAQPAVKTEAETSDVECVGSTSKRRGKASMPPVPLSRIKKEPGSEEAPAASSRTGQRRPSTEGDGRATVRVDVDPVPLPSPIPVRRGRPSKVKAEPADQSIRSTRSRSSSLDTTTSSMATASTKATRRRKRALAGKVLVLFTGFDDENDRLVVQQLGGLIVDSTKKCSVLVTNRIRRTVKFLCAVGLGVPIVSPRWLEMSQRQGKFLDPWQHLLDDPEGQNKFAFDLAASLHAASETPFLAGWIFHATPNVLPPPAQMQEIVESCGGFYIDEGIDDKSAADKKVVISCEQDRASWAAWRRKGALLVSAEAILTGVLRQLFEPETFQLKP